MKLWKQGMIIQNQEFYHLIKNMTPTRLDPGKCFIKKKITVVSKNRSLSRRFDQALRQKTKTKLAEKIWNEESHG